jgi:hypothetical protein
MTNLTAILRAALFCPGPEGFWGLPLLLWGEPGEGKTAVIKALALQLGLPFHRLSPAEQGEGRFGVVPVPGIDGLLHYPPPADLVTLFGDGGLLFVDEISTAPPALQAPLLGLVQLRTLGNHTFPARTRMIGAGNETRDAAGGWDLAPALCNRFGHIDYSGLEANAWAGGLLGHFSNMDGASPGDPLPAAALEAMVMEAWPAADAHARGFVSAFIRVRPELLRKRPAKGSPNRAWPSPRSVEYATVALASAKVHNLSEADTDELMSAFVGQGWVSEYRAWSAMADLPNPSELLDGKVKFEHDNRRLDRTMAVLSACAALVIPVDAKNRLDRVRTLWGLIAAVSKDAPDTVIPIAREILKVRLLLKGAGIQQDTLAALLPLMVQAGIASDVV